MRSVTPPPPKTHRVGYLCLESRGFDTSYSLLGRKVDTISNSIVAPALLIFESGPYVRADTFKAMKQIGDTG